MKISRYLSALVILAICLASCIRENIDDCDTPVEIDFLYFGNGIVDIFPQRIDSVLIFIYDMPSGKLDNTLKLSKTELEERQGTELRLEPGDYRIVCWGNAGDGSRIDPAEGNITSSEYAGGDIPSGIEELYFGDADITVPRTLRPVKETIVYEASYIMMQVELLDFAHIGNPSIDEGNSITALDNGVSDEFSVSLAHGNHPALIDFTNTVSEEVTDYVPELAMHPDRDNSYLANYLVPRFDNDTEAQIRIVRNDTGETIFDRPLADLMEELNIEIDDRNEQMVNLKLQAIVSGTQITIDVAGWNSEIVFPGI